MANKVNEREKHAVNPYVRFGEGGGVLAKSRRISLLAKSSILAAAVVLGFASAVRAEEAYDVVVYGSTPAGITAAVQATRMGKRAVVVSPETRIGGLTTGGLGQTDIGNKRAFGGLALQFYQDVAAFYRDPANWRWQKRESFRLREQGVAATAGSMWVFEPSAALKILEGWEKKEKLSIVRGERLDRTPLAGAAAHRVRGVEMEGGRIVALHTESGRVFRGRTFVDATYEGDLMAGAGVSYFVGREDNKVYGETLSGSQPKQGYHRFLRPVDPYVVKGDPKSGLLPHIDPSPLPADGTGDNHVQAYCYRMCLTDVPENRIPFKKPAGYCEQHYELLLRYVEAGGPILQRNQANMPNRKTDTNNHGGFSTDFIGRNYAYPDASYAERDRILAEHLVYQQGLMWTLANHPRIPKKVRDEFSRWGTCKDEFADGFGDGWQKQLYIREARRMVGAYVMTEHECRRTKVAPHPVGMGAYGMDSHHSRRYVDAQGHVQNEGDVEVRCPKGPYGIDYGALVPKRGECANLLVPVCISASHIAFGSIRMEPVFFALGQAAGTAAVLAVDAGCAVQDVDYAKLRARLVSDGQVVELKPARDNKSLAGFCQLPPGVDNAGNWCAAAKGRVAKLTIQVVGPDESPAGGFRLLVQPGGVLVKSSDDAGFAFAYRTLRKRARVGSDGSWKLPCCHLVDYP